MSKEVLNTLDTLEAEKGISKEVVIDALEAALTSAYKCHYGQAQNIEVEFDQKKGKIHVCTVKEVTEEVMGSQLEVSLKGAFLISPAYEVDDTIRFEVTPKDFGRVAAQIAKQVILQRVRKAERMIIYNEFGACKKGIMQGIVECQGKHYTYVNLDKIEAVLSRQDQMPNEFYRPHDRIKVCVSRVENTSKGPQVFVSRGHPDLLRCLFEQEIPEVYDGVVEIVSIARGTGDRSKVVVHSNDRNINAVSTCVGPKGQRVQIIANELEGESMDIVEWNEDPAVFIANALSPAQVMDVIFDETNPKACTIVIPDYQLSSAIGKRGQNTCLAARLTNRRVDIESESNMAEFYEKQERQNETEESHDEAIVQSDLTNNEYEAIAFNNETIGEKLEA